MEKYCRELDWYEGVLLRPQHFQLLEKKNRTELSRLRSEVSPYFYGVERITINENALASNVISVTDLFVYLPDGTPIEVGKNAVIEARSIDECIGEIDDECMVYIGVRQIKEDFENIESPENRDKSNRLEKSRYINMLNVGSVYDQARRNSQEQIRYLTYNLQIFLSHEKCLVEEFDLLSICKLRKIGNRVVIDESYIPPCGNLLNFRRAKNTLDLFVKESFQNVMEMRDSIRNDGSIENTDLLSSNALKIMGDFAVDLKMQVSENRCNPYGIWKLLRRANYRLSIFNNKPQFNGRLESPSSEQMYDHNQCMQSLEYEYDKLKEIIGQYKVRFDYQTQLEFDGSYYSTVIERSDIMKCSDVFLLVKSSLPNEYLIEVIVENIKIGSRRDIPLLISRSLAGITATLNTPNGDIQIDDTETISFRLDLSENQWDKVFEEKNLSLYLDSPPSDIKFEIVGTY